MIFSETMMQKHFTSEDLTVALHANRHVPKVLKYFRCKKTVSGWFDMMRELQDDRSPAGNRLKRELPGYCNTWAGYGNQKWSDVIKTGLITEAIEIFKKANAGIDTHLTRASPILSPVGGSFSIGRVMQGHPKSAIIRPKAKLPPKEIALTVNVSSGTRHEAIAASMGKIAKACWEYIQAGGIVELTVNYIHNFAEAQEWNGVRHYGILDTVKINPVSMSAYASAASAQFYRGGSMCLGSILAGYWGGGPLGKWANPKAYPISATADDAKAIEALRIR